MIERVEVTATTREWDENLQEVRVIRYVFITDIDGVQGELAKLGFTPKEGK